MALDPDLIALRPLGGFFALRTVPEGARPPGQPLTEVYGAGGPGVQRDAQDAPDALDTRLALVGDRLRVTEPRVRASIAQQGLAARLWSPALACAALYGEVPDLGPLHWDATASAPDDLWLTAVRPLPGDALADTVLSTHLAPLGDTLRARCGIASGLLWGNAASALAGAARQLDHWARANGRRDVAERTAALTDALFARPPLHGTGVRAGTAFRRRSCCLYYRVPGGGVCGDCCFTRAPGSSPRAASG
ncbi:(2Fe-2S)-binding protein [Streptomyces sp. NPDC005435]|uniref:(2Fe-2S)-binding protein n=1 Tax=Streptomyces sp. NPDC005435 TaxID=3154464 RepID=UPI0034533D2F